MGYFGRKQAFFPTISGRKNSRNFTSSSSALLPPSVGAIPEADGVREGAVECLGPRIAPSQWQAGRCEVLWSPLVAEKVEYFEILNKLRGILKLPRRLHTSDSMDRITKTNKSDKLLASVVHTKRLALRSLLHISLVASALCRARRPASVWAAIAGLATTDLRCRTKGGFS